MVGFQVEFESIVLIAQLCNPFGKPAALIKPNCVMQFSKVTEVGKFHIWPVN